MSQPTPTPELRELWTVPGVRDLARDALTYSMAVIFEHLIPHVPHAQRLAMISHAAGSTVARMDRELAP